MEILLYLAPSRSGHNFIKENVSSWLGINLDNMVKTVNGRVKQGYWNFENFVPERFDTKYKNTLKEFGPPTKVIASTRDLLNWVSSFYNSNPAKANSLN